MLEACDKFAPTGKVREKVKETEERYRSLFGEPTDEMKLYSKIFVELVAQPVENLKESPTHEPFDPPAWVNDRFRKDEYGSLYFLVYYEINL